MNARCLCFLLVVLKAVDCVEEVPLPRIDFYMLCSNDVRDINDGTLELDGFYTDLLPSASGIYVEEDAGDPEFLDCNANTNRTQVKMTVNGIAEFNDDDADVLTELEIQNLVTVENLQRYVEAVYGECDTFIALTAPAGTAYGGSQHSSITFAQWSCDLDSTNALMIGGIFAAFCLCNVITVVVMRMNRRKPNMDNTRFLV